ncbi:synaptosomal-associated protein 25 [Pocillopora verrucosa]|uniref:synaptosomal-associated protein 25 n=1 Tax=Pocillopora verrucosa TaxID=203993 RepID=UPI00334013ED
MSDEDRMRSEITRMQMRGDELTDQSLESTRRMLHLAEESQEVGIKTLVALDEQGEQLDRVEENLDQINVDMREAERNLTGLEKCCGLCVCPWRRRKNFEKDEMYKKAFKSSDDGTLSTQPGARYAPDGNRGEAAKSGYIQKITGDDREDEMDENLGQVANIVGNLKSMAMDMGNEIDTQNRQLDRINAKAEANDARIQQANTRARDILRNC